MLRYRSVILLFAIAAACGGADDNDENSDPAPERFPALEEAEPLDLQSVDRGTGVRHGMAVATAFFAGDVYQEVTATVPNAFVYVQAYDEAAPTFGEYQVYPPPPEVMARSATDFIGMNADAGRFENRAPDIVSELETATAEGGGDGWNSVGIVMDLWRLRRDWWVRWDGNLDDEANLKGKGPYGLNRSDMAEDLLDQIESAADQQPRYFIIGDEMGLLLKTDDGDGLSMAEFSNFMWFFQEAASRIKEQSPDTKVGVGFNWDRFVERIAPAYALESDARNLEVLDRAFQAVILPFLENGADIVALKSYRAPDDTEIEFPIANLTVKESYQFLRRLNALYEIDKPIVYYSVGSPVDTPVGYLRQQNYLEAFVDWNAGVEPEMVAWRSMLNFDGTDTADQQIAGRCLAFTTGDRDFEMPESACYDGLVDSVFSTKDPFTYLAGEE
jgi:hypothetical protein